jgi:hypothetical protein
MAYLYIGTATMQQIIDLKAKLESGEIKRYGELRNAIAPYLGEELTFIYDIRTFEGKHQLRLTG